MRREERSRVQKALVHRASRITYHVSRVAPSCRWLSVSGSEQGFTLVELLAVIAILSIVFGILAAILLQFMDVTRAGNGQMAVDGDLRSVGLWLTQDGNEGQTFTGVAGCDTFVFDTGPEHGAVYTYTLNSGTLWRDDGTTTRGVARHVSDVVCPTGMVTGTVGITVYSSSAGVSANQTYTVTLRVR
jgi:prepilin-type N-terminal cleavage/methylation domain-containing protein